LIKRNNKKVIPVRDSSCLNCGHPFFGREKFCADCGQANKGNKITFRSFVHEIFNGLFSFDTKFWRTIIPLLTSPGKVSKNYVSGKRNRYSNPFRFYLTISILFFLIVGISKSKEKFEKLTKENSETIGEILQKEFKKNTKELKKQDIDSLKKEMHDELDNSFIPIPKGIQNKNLADLETDVKDTTAIKPKNRPSFDDDTKLGEFINYQIKYPESKIDPALDSLQYAKNFTNRFLYTRATIINSFLKDENNIGKFADDFLSYGSISLFVFLPLFTLFLRFLYFRRKHTYVDHLIFVFHTQTVLFMLLSIVYLISFFTDITHTWITFILFLLYLFLAMKKFYNQGYFKTVVKFLLLNIAYLFMGTIGVIIVGLISFVLY
jgi:hypothetical protein